eukprot:2037955-Lingulodinium_polyedra.AAC.1
MSPVVRPFFGSGLSSGTVWSCLGVLTDPPGSVSPSRFGCGFVCSVTCLGALVDPPGSESPSRFCCGFI